MCIVNLQGDAMCIIVIHDAQPWLCIQHLLDRQHLEPETNPASHRPLCWLPGHTLLDCCVPLLWNWIKSPKPWLFGHGDVEGDKQGCLEEQQLLLPCLRRAWVVPTVAGSDTVQARVWSRVQLWPCWLCASASTAFGSLRKTKAYAHSNALYAAGTDQIEPSALGD